MLPQPSFASKIISFIKIAITTSAHIIVARLSSGLCSASVEKSSQSLPRVSPFLLIRRVSKGGKEDDQDVDHEVDHKVDHDIDHEVDHGGNAVTS